MAQEVLLDDAVFLKEIVERVLQEVLEAEMTEHIGAAPHERTAGRKGHRNGHKPRTLRTRVGTLNLLVPQDREGTFSTRLFSRYQRNEKALVLALMEMYLEGVSTRKVKDITEELCGTSFSKSLISSLAGSLDAELRAWRNRRLEGVAYPYLFVDARYEKARVGYGVVSQGVLVVSAVREGGLRQIVGVEISDTESEATYHELFRSLKARGLRGDVPVVSDDNEGLKAAVGRHFQGATWQRCQVHYARNLLGTVGPRGARSSKRIYEESSLRWTGAPPLSSPPLWPRSGTKRATRRLPSTSKSRWRSASPAWLSRRVIGGAFAPPTAWRGSTSS